MKLFIIQQLYHVDCGPNWLLLVAQCHGRYLSFVELPLGQKAEKSATPASESVWVTLRIR